jgi:amino acid adenylation domain-containing protein
MSAAGTRSSFPLVPMQEGMLFNSLRAPGSGVDILVGVLDIQEPVDAARLRSAWQHVVDHHPSLRSAFDWEGEGTPLQVVSDQARLPFRTEDWSECAPEEQERRWEELRRRDRAEGFVLSEAPLMRVTLVRLGAANFRMLWPIHHALVDTLAMTVLLEQVFGTYDALDSGDTYELEHTVPQQAYSDWFHALDLAEARDSWREALEGVGDAARLGLDTSATADAEPCVQDTAMLRLTAPATSALVGWCKQHGTSVNTVLQGAWSLLLSQYGGQRRVVFGAVKSCRRSCMEGGDGMIGLALNTLPFLVDVDPERELLDWLGGLRTQWVGLRAYEHTPLVNMKEWAGVARQTPLFETVLCFDPLHYAEAMDTRSGDWSRRRLDIFGQPDAPLTLNAFGGERLSVRMTYDPRRFDADTAQAMLAHLETLLASFVEGAGRPLGELVVLPAAERAELLEVCNRPMEAAPDDACLHHLFAAQVAATPDAFAVAHGGERLTYVALQERACALAHALVTRGVQPGDRVGLCLERSPEAVVAVLGILQAGAGYVPFDPSWPPARLSVMAQTATLAALVTHGAARALAESVAADTPVICLDRDADELRGQPTTPPEVAVGPNDLAYVLFTSGSTGRPKGVAMPHGPLVNLMRWQREQSPPGAAAATLQFAPLGFDVSCQELFATLLAGGCLHLVNEAERRDPHALLQRLCQDGITRLFMPFVALQQLVETAMDQGPFPASLVELVTAGEQLQVGPTLVEFFRRLDGAVLVNQYGPTECHVVTAWTLDGDPGAWPALPPIGRPIANARAYVVSESLQLAPKGAPGELCLAGAMVGRGYLGDPELTDRAFVADPFDPRPGARMYRTGDLAMVLPDGSLQFLGRRDGQVKLRGFRVELGEVETVLLAHPGVRSAAAVVREDQPGDQRLVAYVVGEGGAPVATDDLRGFLRERLPGFMVPSAVLVLDDLPLTPSGKLDRRRLPAPGERQLSEALVEPRSDTERELAQLWSGLLLVDRLGVTDDFFELGGHSLLAMRMVSRVRDAFGVEVPLQRLFEDPTVAGLAEHLDTLRWVAGSAGSGPGSGDDEVFEL